jgi:hypothetical protein
VETLSTTTADPIYKKTSFVRSLVLKPYSQSAMNYPDALDQIIIDCGPSK